MKSLRKEDLCCYAGKLPEEVLEEMRPVGLGFKSVGSNAERVITIKRGRGLIPRSLPRHS